MNHFSIFTRFRARSIKTTRISKILNVQHLEKHYKSGDRDLHVLQDISFEIESGETFAIVGPSGSGKTTLLGICAGLDTPDSGTISLCGTELQGLTEDGRAQLRNTKVGFIFQDFQLLPTLSALENVAVPLELQGEKRANAIAKDLLIKVGLEDRLHHYPLQLSGGEQQRVALARAFSNRPSILFADEPTGDLDHETGEKVIELLFNLNKEAGTTLVIVTHDLELAARTGRVLKLKAGQIQSIQKAMV